MSPLLGVKPEQQPLRAWDTGTLGMSRPLLRATAKLSHSRSDPPPDRLAGAWGRFHRPPHPCPPGSRLQLGPAATGMPAETAPELAAPTRPPWPGPRPAGLTQGRGL